MYEKAQKVLFNIKWSKKGQFNNWQSLLYPAIQKLDIILSSLWMFPVIERPDIGSVL
jgi:hypothetical protein